MGICVDWWLQARAPGQQEGNGGGRRGRSAARGGDVDMEVTFAPGLETLGERLAAKRAPKQAETVWEQYLRRRRCRLTPPLTTGSCMQPG